MKIGIVGCAGRMGRMLVAEVLSNKDLSLVGGTEHEESSYIGQDIASLVGFDEVGVDVGCNMLDLFDSADVVIDFTLPKATVLHAEAAINHGTALVIGTTGLSRDQQNFVEEASKTVTIVQAANYSLGVNLLLGLTSEVASLLEKDYDIEISEMHHRHKIDAPSGTALALGQAAADGRGVDLESVSNLNRNDMPRAREEGGIGFSSMRGGDVVGDHTVIFATDGERIELTHKASSRSIFARGAVRSARWCKDKSPGLYSIRDVLGI